MPGHSERCAGLLADYCRVTQNVCQDLPVRVKIFNVAGKTPYQGWLRQPHRLLVGEAQHLGGYRECRFTKSIEVGPPVG